MIGRTISHYRVISRVGAGGMGTVWLAEDTTLQRRVALKFLSEGAAPTEEATVRLVREARAASALDHPHIGTIYEVGDFEGQPFIAMAYYEGETLADALVRGPFTIAETARIVAQVADALSAAHAAGIVHRDLKPANLMLTASGQVKVLDFGIATVASAAAETMTRLTAAGSTIGTAGYMSPEQAAGLDSDVRCDIWALGVVTREMLTGRQVYERPNVLAVLNAVMNTEPQPIRDVRPDVPGELKDIVSQRDGQGPESADDHGGGGPGPSDRVSRATHIRPCGGGAARGVAPRVDSGGGGCRGRHRGRQHLVDPEERKGPMGARASAAGDHPPGRSGSVRRRLSPGRRGAQVHTGRSPPGRAGSSRDPDRRHRVRTLRSRGVLSPVWSPR